MLGSVCTNAELSTVLIPSAVKTMKKTATHLFQTRHSAERTTENILLMFITIILLRLKNQNFDCSKSREDVFHWNGHTLLRISYTGSKATTPS